MERETCKYTHTQVGVTSVYVYIFVLLQDSSCKCSYDRKHGNAHVTQFTNTGTNEDSKLSADAIIVSKCIWEMGDVSYSLSTVHVHHNALCSGITPIWTPMGRSEAVPIDE